MPYVRQVATLQPHHAEDPTRIRIWRKTIGYHTDPALVEWPCGGVEGVYHTCAVNAAAVYVGNDMIFKRMFLLNIRV